MIEIGKKVAQATLKVINSRGWFRSDPLLEFRNAASLALSHQLTDDAYARYFFEESSLDRYIDPTKLYKHAIWSPFALNGHIIHFAYSYNPELLGEMMDFMK